MTALPVVATVTNASGLATTRTAVINVDDAPPAGTIPLSYNDPRFSSNTTSGSVTLPNNGTIQNKSITATGATASIVTRNGATIRTCRVNSREAVRIGGGGNFLIEDSYLEATGQGSDHADTIQAYSPGSVGNLIVRRTAIVAHNNAATAGLFIADKWSGSVTLENVMFNGGPFGCRIHSDAGPGTSLTLSFKDVFFVGPFGYNAVLINSINAPLIISRWENVRNATIVNGALVPGSLIPRPG